MLLACRQKRTPGMRALGTSEVFQHAPCWPQMPGMPWRCECAIGYLERNTVPKVQQKCWSKRNCTVPFQRWPSTAPAATCAGAASQQPNPAELPQPYMPLDLFLIEVFCSGQVRHLFPLWCSASPGAAPLHHAHTPHAAGIHQSGHLASRRLHAGHMLSPVAQHTARCHDPQHWPQLPLFVQLVCALPWQARRSCAHA
jgi:hypothetical protein